MIKEKYFKKISANLNRFSKGKKVKIFIYGSSLRQDHFGDIDIGVMGEVNDKDIRELKEKFEDSTLPYFVEIVNFNNVSGKFRNNVFNNEILWIKQ